MFIFKGKNKIKYELTFNIETFKKQIEYLKNNINQFLEDKINCIVIISNETSFANAPKSFEIVFKTDNSEVARIQYLLQSKRNNNLFYESEKMEVNSYIEKIMLKSLVDFY